MNALGKAYQSAIEVKRLEAEIKATREQLAACTIASSRTGIAGALHGLQSDLRATQEVAGKLAHALGAADKLRLIEMLKIPVTRAAAAT